MRATSVGHIEGRLYTSCDLPNVAFCNKPAQLISQIESRGLEATDDSVASRPRTCLLQDIKEIAVATELTAGFFLFLVIGENPGKLCK